VPELDTTLSEHPNFTLEHVSEAVRDQDLGEMVRAGLTDTPKWLSPFVFYDARGSELFEAICRLDAYYVTRTEAAIFEAHAADMIADLPPDLVVFELGSGSSLKSEIVLRAALARARPVTYVPTDISEAAIVDAAERLTRSYADLEVHGVVASYEDAAEAVHDRYPSPRLGLFMGGNIGNFAAGDALGFMKSLRHAADPGDHLIAGFDLVKDIDVLKRAYDDPEGVTAEFNLNALHHINRKLDAQFDVSSFRHLVRWNPELSRIEMHLESTKDQTVRIGGLDLQVRFAKGETIHTENSHKYTPERIETLAREAGWSVDRTWTDPNRYFCVTRLRPRD
jgi:L-histidine Nalpha-methyltransferase